ncbi:hypothetical protein DDW07_01235 [Acidilobus sp. SCGC AC-742_E15]|nr:hypothetical protein DDW07_01235 [Acidilobus sp. SCGC AC-742_E15]
MAPPMAGSISCECDVMTLPRNVEGPPHWFMSDITHEGAPAKLRYWPQAAVRPMKPAIKAEAVDTTSRA